MSHKQQPICSAQVQYQKRKNLDISRFFFMLVANAALIIRPSSSPVALTQFLFGE